jgi:hypothetical protein
MDLALIVGLFRVKEREIPFTSLLKTGAGRVPYLCTSLLDS